MERSRLVLPVLVTLAAVMLLVIGGAMLLIWVLTPDTSIGDLFDRIRPYLPVQYGQTINSAPEDGIMLALEGPWPAADWENLR